MGAVLSPFATGTVKMTPYTYITTGTVSLPNTGGTWAILKQTDTVSNFELDIAAIVGDRVALAYNGVRSGTNPVDVGVVVGTTIVRFLSSGTVTPSNDGDTAWYAGSTLPTVGGLRGFTVTAGDLDGANVRFCIVSNGSAAAGTFIATAADTFSWQAFNFGH